MSTKSISAVITMVNGNWYARFMHRRREHRLPVGKSDAWTYDVEDGLKVSIKLVRGHVVVTGRRGKNRYVRAGEDGCRI